MVRAYLLHYLLIAALAYGAAVALREQVVLPALEGPAAVLREMVGRTK